MFVQVDLRECPGLLRPAHNSDIERWDVPGCSALFLLLSSHLSVPAFENFLLPCADLKLEDGGHPAHIKKVNNKIKITIDIFYFRLCNLKSIHGKSRKDASKLKGSKKVKNGRSKDDQLGDMSSDEENNMDKAQSDEDSRVTLKTSKVKI